MNYMVLFNLKIDYNNWSKLWSDCHTHPEILTKDFFEIISNKILDVNVTFD
jgi:hypothetical protein